MTAHAPLRVDAAVYAIRAGSAEYYAAATNLQRQALLAFLEHDYERSEMLTREAREARRDGDGALEAEMRLSAALLEKRA